MKKILIILSLLLAQNIECKNWWNKAIDKVKGLPKRGKACAEVVALGPKWLGVKGGLEIAEKAVKLTQQGTDAVAFQSAKKTLDAAQASGTGVLILADAIAKGIQKGFNIKCVRFLGKLDQIRFELIANLFGQEITINEKVDFTSPQEFAQKVFNILKDKAVDIGKKLGIKV